MTIVTSHPPLDVLGVVSFGSYARGNAETHSDIDVCIFSSSLKSSETRDRRWYEFVSADPRIEVSTYDAATAKVMASEGSLFLWHLKLEGRIEFQRDQFVTNLLAGLKPCRDLLQELQIHQDVYNVAFDGRRRGEKVNAFDVSVLYLVVRNVSILICAKMRKFKFGARDAFEQVYAQVGSSSVSREDFDMLLDHHLLYKRGVPLVGGIASDADCERLMLRVQQFLDAARSIIGSIDVNL
jgi:predicted nucleotidyltransferase